jgi:hypothetical protein
MRIKMKHILEYNKFNEPVNEGLSSLLKKGLTYLLSPIIVPFWANSNTEFKLKIIKSSIDTYITNKAHYEMLDEWKYDQDFPPSKFTKLSKKLIELKKKSQLEKYKTIQDYGKAFCDNMKKLNIINFRNKEDYDFLCDKIMEYCNREPEKGLIDEVKSFNEIDSDTFNLNGLRRRRTPGIHQYESQYNKFNNDYKVISYEDNFEDTNATDFDVEIESSNDRRTIQVNYELFLNFIQEVDPNLKSYLINREELTDFESIFGNLEE